MRKVILLLIALAAVFALVTWRNSKKVNSGTREAADTSAVGETPAATPEPTGTGRVPTPAPTTVIAEATPTPVEPEVKKPLLYINEILPTNTKYSEKNKNYYDVIELYNASEETIQLSDYCLSDSKKHLTDYPLPEAELPSGGYVLLYCTGKYAAKDDYDLAFKLSYFGEKVFLSDRQGNVIDKVEYPRLPQNVSYGRSGAGEGFRIFDTPSLGAANGDGLERMAAVPDVDLEPGFHGGTQKVSFITEGTIRYTLDGSKPGPSSKVWDGEPITLSANCTLRAYASQENCLDSFTASFCYNFDAPEYELDVLMLTMKQSDFDTMTENYQSSRKYAANLSLFSDGRLEFSEDCAVSNFGGSSRAYIKKSYQVTFSSAYGASKLRYRMFDNLDIDEFNSLVLRSGSQDVEGAMMKDEFVSSLAMSGGVIDDVLVQAYRPVNLYVNGEYRGIYYIREHIDEDMVASHYGCDPEEVTIVKQMHTVSCGSDGKEFTDLWKFISENRLKDTEAYEYVKSVVNLQSVADYYIIQLWNGNIDMDNVRVCKYGDGKWFYILYDCDLTLNKMPEGITAEQLGTFNAGYYTFNALVYRLLENPEFRELFCQRMALIYKEVFNEENALAYIDELEAKIIHDMPYNCKRWNPVKDPVKKTNYRSYSGWQSSVKLLRQMVTGRCARVIADFVKTKGISDELAEKYFSEFR